MNKAPIVLWVNKALPATGSVVSATQGIMNYLGYAVQVEWSGSPTGTFTLQGSCDSGTVLADGTATGVSNWTTISSTSVAATGTSGSALYNMSFAFYGWFRLVYTATSGTGTANSMAVIKG